MDGFTFGLVDNGIVLIGMYLGVDIDGWISNKFGKKANPVLGAVVGATLSNTISDGVAAVIDPSMSGMAVGIMLGCLTAMIAIPIAEKIKGRK